MISEGSLTNDPSRQTRIEKAVEQETRRRKRLLIIYGLFLVIPFGVGAGFLIYGHSDREVLTIEREVLKSEVNRRLALVEATIKQTEPALQQVRDMAGQVSSQEKRLDSLSREQDSLMQLNASINTGKEDPIQSLKKELADMDNRLSQQDNLLALMDARLSQQDNLLALMRNNLTQQENLLTTYMDDLKNEYNSFLQKQAILLDRLEHELKVLAKRKRPPVQPPFL